MFDFATHADVWCGCLTAESAFALDEKRIYKTPWFRRGIQWLTFQSSMQCPPKKMVENFLQINRPFFHSCLTFSPISGAFMNLASNWFSLLTSRADRLKSWPLIIRSTSLRLPSILRRPQIKMKDSISYPHHYYGNQPFASLIRPNRN